MLLFRRLYPLAIWVGLAFHTAMLVMTNITFGMYYFAACASYLAFVTWPKEPLTVFYDRDCSFCAKAKRFFEKIDLERRCRWTSWQQAGNAQRCGANVPQSAESVRLIVGERQYNGF